MIFSNSILIGEFRPYQSEKSPEIEKQILDVLKKELSQKNWKVFANKENKESFFKSSKSKDFKFYIEGQYSKPKSESLSIYVQIYDPETGKIIDAVSESLNLNSFENIKLEESEIIRSNEDIIGLIAKQISIELELNPEKKQSKENIEEHLVTKPIYKDGLFSISQLNTKEEARETFRLIEEETVISSTKTKTSLKRAPNIVSIISDTDIKNYGRVSINDILYQLPGFAPSQINERRTVSSRGMYEGWNNNHLLMLVDGVQHNELFYGSALTWEITPLNMIKSLEVIRGPGSALYGSNATNGVISLNTYSGKDLKGTIDMRVRMGDHGTKIYDFLTGNKGELFSHVVSFNSYETKGNNYVNYDGSERTNIFGVLEKFPHKDQRNSYYLYTKLEGEDFLKGLSFVYHRQNWNFQTFNGWLQNVPDTKDRYSEYRDVFTTKYTNDISNKLKQEYVFQYSKSVWDFNYSALPSSEDYPQGVTENLKTNVENLFLRAQLNYSFYKEGTFIAGVEGNRLSYKGDITHDSNINMNILGDESQNPNGVYRPLNPFMEWIVNKPILKFAPFLQFTSGKLLGNNLELTASIRYDETSMNYRGIDQPYKNWIGTPEVILDNSDPTNPITHPIPNQVLGPPFVTNEKKTYRRTSPRLGLVYLLNERISFKAMVGQAFREPAAGELFGVNTYVGGSNNPRKINPEVVKTAELGIDFKLNQNLNLRINGFNTRFENAIEYASTDNQIINAYTVGTRGIESEFIATFQNFSGFINYSRFYRFVDHKLDATISKHPNEVTLAPAHTMNFGVSMNLNNWTSSLSVQRQGKVFRNKSDLGEIDPITGHLTYDNYNNPYQYPQYRPKTIPSWTNINFRVSYKITPKMQLGLYVTNLLNSNQKLIQKGAYPIDYIREDRRVMLDFQASF